MAISVGGAIDWAGEHPIAATAIGAAALIFVLWLFGAFSRKSDGGADAATQSMTAAYYAAEAQQAVVGGQIQVANIMATRDSAIAGMTTDAAVKINKAQTKAAVTINQQNADTTTRLGEFDLFATRSNNEAAVQMNRSNNESLLAGLLDTNRAGVFTTFLNSILPAELAASAGSGYFADLGPFGQFGRTGTLSPQQMRAAGYSEQQIRIASGG